MNSVYVLVLLACVFAVTCSANTYRMGGCPRVTVMKNIDMDRFTGDWHVIQRFNPLATCTKISIERGSNDTYALNETSRPFGLNFNFHKQHLKPRKLNFLKNNTYSIFRLQRNFAHFALSTFGVVDTDYTNYAVLWGCDPVLFGSVQNVDILSRDTTASKDIIKKARDTMLEMNVDIYPLENVDQSRCENSPEESAIEGAKPQVPKNTNNMVADSP